MTIKPCRCDGGACEEPGLGEKEFCARKRCADFLRDFGISPDAWRQGILAQAKLELAAELRAAQVEQEKARLRARSNRTIWQKLFPWKVVRRDR